MKEKLIKALEIYGFRQYKNGFTDAFEMAKTNLCGRSVYATNTKKGERWVSCSVHCDGLLLSAIHTSPNGRLASVWDIFGIRIYRHVCETTTLANLAIEKFIGNLDAVEDTRKSLVARIMYEKDNHDKVISAIAGK
jgi:hypothetical protein